jgi:phosphoglycerate dehydrogenase-like enzyme
VSQGERPRVVVLNDVPPGYYAVVPSALEPLAGRADVSIHTSEAASPAQLKEWLRGAWATIDIRARSIFDSAVLTSLPDLRVIVVRGTTAPLVDVECATRQGVLVCNTPYQSTEAVSEYALALLLAAVRRIPAMDARLRRGEWRSTRGFTIAGKTLGVIGLGMIGQAMCRLGRAVGMQVIGWSPTVDAARAAACGCELVDLDTLLRTSHAVSLHLRLSPTTLGIIGSRELALLKDGAIFVNTARGRLVDEAALIDELRSGRLIGAIDVFADEPIGSDHPLLSLDNVIVTPHAGWATEEVRESRARVPIENVVAALLGRPQNVMNPQVLDHFVWRKQKQLTA